MKILKISNRLKGCDCQDCPKCGGEAMVCAKCGQCTGCSQHTPNCQGCQAGAEYKRQALQDGLAELRQQFANDPDKLAAIEEAEQHLRNKGVLP